MISYFVVTVLVFLRFWITKYSVLKEEIIGVLPSLEEYFITTDGARTLAFHHLSHAMVNAGRESQEWLFAQMRENASISRHLAMEAVWQAE